MASISERDAERIFGIKARRRGRLTAGTKVDLDGYTFDSKEEYQRYLELRREVAFGTIKNLEVHPFFEIATKSKATGKRELICTYTADFAYIVIKSGERIVEDVKSLQVREDKRTGKRVAFGTATHRDWKLKRKMMHHLLGIEVREVLMDKSIRSILKHAT